MNVRTLGMVMGLALAGTAVAQGQQGQMQQGQHELRGTVVGTREKHVFIQEQSGAIVPLEVNHETLVEGQRIKRDQRIESHLKREFTEGEQVRASFDTKKTDNVATSIQKAQQK